VISTSLERALRACIEAHEGQLRKAADPAPYAVHPLHMALLLARFGACEAVVEAALLHDTVEDSADWTAERLAAEFGDKVAAIVAELTEDKSLSWTERKELGIEHVEHMSADAVLVKGADKLHNLSSLAAELQTAADPQEVWADFKGGREATLAMSQALVEALAPRLPKNLAQELQEAFARVSKLA
jgi:(p)ppGpp synthase/HD superfamily hydrolase